MSGIKLGSHLGSLARRQLGRNGDPIDNQSIIPLYDLFFEDVFMRREFLEEGWVVVGKIPAPLLYHLPWIAANIRGHAQLRMGEIGLNVQFFNDSC